MEELEVDKFKLSLWLSYLIHYSGEIPNEKMDKSIKILFDTLSGTGYIYNFNLWEKYFTFLFKHKKYDDINRLIKNITYEINGTQIQNTLYKSKLV